MRGFGVFLLIAMMVAIMAVSATSVASENANVNDDNTPPSVSGVPAIEPVVVEAASRTYRRTLPVLRTLRGIHEARTACRIARQTAKTDIEVTTSPGRVYDRRPGLLGKLAALVRTGPAPDH